MDSAEKGSSRYPLMGETVAAPITSPRILEGYLQNMGMNAAVELRRFFVTVLWMPPPDSVAAEGEGEGGEEGLNFLSPGCDFVVREERREARKTPTVDGKSFQIA